MWISRKRLNLLEKRVADLEEKVQSQPKEIITMISRHQKEQMTKSYRPRDPWGRKSRPVEISSLEIDFDRDILKINGKDIKSVAVIVTLPGAEEKFPVRKLFNPELATGNKEECDRLEVVYKKAG